MEIERKKILFVSPDQNPFEHGIGTTQRTNLLLKACLEFAEVDVFTFSGNRKYPVLPHCNVIFREKKQLTEKKNISKWEKWKPIIVFWKRESIFPFDQESAEEIRKIITENQYDFIVVRYLSKAVECGLLDFSSKLIVDVDDLPSDQYRMRAAEFNSLSGKIRNYILAFSAYFMTRRMLGKVHCAFFPNPTQLMGENAVYLPNIPYYQQEVCPDIDFSKVPKRICFIGELGHPPNEQGIDYFLENIYTKLHKKMPDAEFYIGGKIWYPRLKEKWEKYPNVHLTGYVDSLSDFYEQSRVVVVPIYVGGGTNIKFLEAARMKRACITTQSGFRGFDAFFENGKDCFVVKNTDEFVENLISLLTDESQNKKMATNAYEKVKQYFSKEKFNKIVKEAIK